MYEEIEAVSNVILDSNIFLFLICKDIFLCFKYKYKNTKIKTVNKRINIIKIIHIPDIHITFFKL